MLRDPRLAVLVEPGPSSANFFENLVGGVDQNPAAAYLHVAGFGDTFRTLT